MSMDHADGTFAPSEIVGERGESRSGRELVESISGKINMTVEGYKKILGDQRVAQFQNALYQLSSDVREWENIQPPATVVTDRSYWNTFPDDAQYMSVVHESLNDGLIYIEKQFVIVRQLSRRDMELELRLHKLLGDILDVQTKNITTLREKVKTEQYRFIL